MANPLLEVPKCPICGGVDAWLMFIEKGVRQALHMFCNECCKEWEVPFSNGPTEEVSEEATQEQEAGQVASEEAP